MFDLCVHVHMIKHVLWEVIWEGDGGEERL